MKLLNFLLLPFWYPIISTDNLYSFPKKLTIFSKPYVIYKNKENDYVIHSDICPHQGASLSEGWITKNYCLSCPYHGFQFNNGSFCNIPNPKNRKIKPFHSRIQLERFFTKKEDDFLFISETEDSPAIFFPPEETNKKFRGVDGTLMISTNYLSVCENLLDMLHISYVHSFGSRKTPLPTSIEFKKISDYHGQSTFRYEPNPNTISGKVGNVKEVIVENEFILPTNTLTRVFAGKTIKTVFTRSIPISDDKTLLYWKIYRNFWIENLIIQYIGDFLIQRLMEKTLKEDVSILKKIYPEERQGKLRTKYDRTILEFRKAHDFFLKKI